MRIKNWAKFQHFKDRKPPWVKLYRDLLDDLEWHELEPEAAKALVMLWLIASESDGQLPDVKKLSFRLRLSTKETERILKCLSHWLEQDDINVISDCHPPDIALIPLARSQETEAERETEVETDPARKRAAVTDFDRFWSAYPKRKSKGQAEKVWARLRPDTSTVGAILASVEAGKRHPDWIKDDGRYIPHPATWLNAKGWLDETPAVIASTDGWWVRAGFGSELEARAAGETAPP